MSSFNRVKSPETKLITLYNLNLPQSQSQQSFRVQTNTTVFDLINHLKKCNDNKEIQLFIQPNQLFTGNPNQYLFPILQQNGVRTIKYTVSGESPLTQTQQATNKEFISESNPNPVKSQYNYANQSTSSYFDQQNQSQISNQSVQKDISVKDIVQPSHPYGNQQGRQQFIQENSNLSQQLNALKLQKLELEKENAYLKYNLEHVTQQSNQLQENQQKMQQSNYFQNEQTKQANEKIKQQDETIIQLNGIVKQKIEELKKLTEMYEREKWEKENYMREIDELKKKLTQQQQERHSIVEKVPSPLIESPLKSSIFYRDIGSPTDIGRLSSTTINQSTIRLKLKCSHQMVRGELEKVIQNAMTYQITAQCTECQQPIGLGICKQLGQVGQTYIDYKCKQDLRQIQQKVLEKKFYYLQCNNRSCSFFCINTPKVEYNSYQPGYCPQCLQVTMKVHQVSLKIEFNKQQPTCIPSSSITVNESQRPSQNLQTTQNFNSSRFQYITPTPQDDYQKFSEMNNQQRAMIQDQNQQRAIMNEQNPINHESRFMINEQKQMANESRTATNEYRPGTNSIRPLTSEYRPLGSKQIPTRNNNIKINEVQQQQLPEPKSYSYASGYSRSYKY